MWRNQGLVIKQGEQALALVVYYLKGRSCRILLAHALQNNNPHLMMHHLLQGLISLVQKDPEINSLRCDVVPWFAPSVLLAMESSGFTCVKRMMMRRLAPCPREAPAFPARIRLVPWDNWLTGPAAQIMHAAFGNGFEGTWDRALNELDGCKQFIADCYSGRFGEFQAGVSFALQYENLWMGMALASRSGDEGFIPVFGLLPQFSGQGLGSVMLAHLLRRFGRGINPPSYIELAVSVENHPAVHLYKKFGFVKESEYMVYYLNL
jgi:ribosomal protein S18 acetylase RimI-like enzyme